MLIVLIFLWALKCISSHLYIFCSKTFKQSCLNDPSIWVSFRSPLLSFRRAVFDRTIHLSVSVKKIKFFFKRYLEYEKKHGTPQSVQAVKEKAMEFVEAKGKDAAN